MLLIDQSVSLWVATPEMSDPNGAPNTGAETTTMESKSTWTSTSSAETESDNFWHDSVSPRLVLTE